jgi:prepilin-type processing-associated H-X9-DG protein
MDGFWNWHGNLDARWALGRESADPLNDVIWESNMAGWRHGPKHGANVLFCDGHYGAVGPGVPSGASDKPVDTARVFTWLPGEGTLRCHYDNYGAGGGEVKEWLTRVPELAGFGGYPRWYPEELNTNTRSEKHLWKKLPADKAKRS